MRCRARPSRRPCHSGSGVTGASGDRQCSTHVAAQKDVHFSEKARLLSNGAVVGRGEVHDTSRRHHGHQCVRSRWQVALSCPARRIRVWVFTSRAAATESHESAMRSRAAQAGRKSDATATAESRGVTSTSLRMSTRAHTCIATALPRLRPMLSTPDPGCFPSTTSCNAMASSIRSRCVGLPLLAPSRR